VSTACPTIGALSTIQQGIDDRELAWFPSRDARPNGHNRSGTLVSEDAKLSLSQPTPDMEVAATQRSGIETKHDLPEARFQKLTVD